MQIVSRDRNAVRAPAPSAAKSSRQVKQPIEPIAIHLKPRPVLFRVLLIVFGIWVAMLIALYILTVHNRRPAQGSVHSASLNWAVNAIRPGAPGLPLAPR